MNKYLHRSTTLVGLLQPTTSKLALSIRHLVCTCLLGLLLLGSSNSLQAQTNALNFDGNDDYITTSGTIMAAGASYTKEAWVNLNNTTSNLNIISSSGNPFWVTGGKLTVGHNASYFFLQESGTMTANTWTHVAVTYDANASTLTLYKNGVVVGSSSAAPAFTGNQVQIGAHTASGFFAGSMDEVRIWNVVRTQAEIQASMNSEFCAAQTGLILYYKLNEGTAGGDNSKIVVATDASGNNNAGTLIKFAATGSTSNFIASTDGVTACAFAATNNALNFDGNNDYITTSGTLLAAGSSYTKEAWVNLNNTTSNLNIISSSGNPFWVTGGKLTVGHNASYFFFARIRNNDG